MASTRSRSGGREHARPASGKSAEHAPRSYAIAGGAIVVIIAFLALTSIGHVIDAATQHFMLFYAGVFALIGLCASVGLGLVATNRMFLNPAHRVFIQSAHRAASFGAVTFLLIHIVTEILAQRVHVIDAVVPFLSPFRTFYIGLGTIASDLVLLLVITGILRGRFNASGKAWRWRAIHYTSYAAFVFGVWHGLLGGRPGKPYVDWSYGFLIALVLLGLAVRIFSDSLKPKENLSGPPVPMRAPSATAPLRAAAIAAQLSVARGGIGRPAAVSGAQPALLAPLGAPVITATALPAGDAAAREPLYEPGYEGPARYLGAPRSTGPIPRRGTGPLPRSATGPQPAAATGPQPRPGSGALPAQAPPQAPHPSGPFQLPGTGDFRTADTGPQPVFGTGPVQAHPSGPFPVVDAGPQPVFGAGPVQAHPSGPFPLPGHEPRPRYGTGPLPQHPGTLPSNISGPRPSRPGPADEPGGEHGPFGRRDIRPQATSGPLPRADSGPLPSAGGGRRPRWEPGPLPGRATGPIAWPGDDSRPDGRRQWEPTGPVPSRYGAWGDPSYGLPSYVPPAYDVPPYRDPAYAAEPPAWTGDGGQGWTGGRSAWPGPGNDGSRQPARPPWEAGVPEADLGLRYREPGPGMPGYRGSREDRYGGDRH